MSTVRTVSDTKKAFYTHHTRPINSIYRRVVEELMVEMHLLSVNVDYRYDPIYGLGVVTAYERFMQGYRPEQDRTSIFNAICQSIGDEPQKYQQDAEQLKAEASSLPLPSFLEQVKQLGTSQAGGVLGMMRGIADNPTFKYSRLFAIGLYSLVETMDAEAAKDETKRNEALQTLSESLHLPFDKMQKDLELYRSNLEKITQAQIVMEDILKADRKKKEERAKAKEDAFTVCV
ncbi:MAG: photosystem II biogenesis protein Psp29 [Oculatellaceae cyanobacterium Prado106]|nr:photosystem II biogenesis protein Psp29 [Oculatellaceae cyanobacterium Prado106]